MRVPGLPFLVGAANRVVRDQLRRATVAAYEVDRALARAMAHDRSLPYSVRQQAGRLFETAMPRDSAPTRVRSRCALTGRGRGVFSAFRLSRIMLRRLATEGLVPGVKKASW
jgi:small subunit ribosomal protein S14